jgi:ankyrin repeat protein
MASKSQTPMELRLKAIIECLLAKGADPNGRDSSNWTPIHLAAKGQNKKTLQWLLSLNNELARKGFTTFDFQSTGGTKNWTPLHVASY